ncbi:MAG: VanZ family protein [Gammaproteobacteria bacterium]
MTAFARYWLPPLLWMTLIWGLSSDIGSADTTSGLFGWLMSQLFPWATPAQIRFAHDLVRKLGHLTEYAILAALWFRAFHVGRGLSSPSSAWTALAISIGWAIADELHQAFVPSRTASPVDVLLDATGATLSTLAAHALTTLKRPLPHPSPRASK